MECSMPYRADVSEPDPSPSIISKYLAEPDPARRVPLASDGLGSGIHPLVQWFPNFLQSRTPSDIQSPATYPRTRLKKKTFPFHLLGEFRFIPFRLILFTLR